MQKSEHANAMETLMRELNKAKELAAIYKRASIAPVNDINGSA